MKVTPRHILLMTVTSPEWDMNDLSRSIDENAMRIIEQIIKKHVTAGRTNTPATDDPRPIVPFACMNVCALLSLIVLTRKKNCKR